MPTILALSSHPLAADSKFASAMQALAETSYREVNRDGNCLYASIALHIFPLLSNLDFKSGFFGFTEAFKTVGVSSVVYECYISAIEDLLDAVTIDTMEFEDITVLIAYLRLICSTHAILNSERYQSFVERDLKRYCAECIDPMEQRAGELELAVLSDALKLRIRVISVADGVNSTFGEGEEIKILHTPDHFEPIYG